MDSNFRRNLPPKAYAVKRDKPRLHPQVEATLSNKHQQLIGVKAYDTTIDTYYVHSKDTFYQGNWMGGLPHGKGNAIYPDGSLYYGNFEQGEAQDGHAFLILPNGSFYQGQVHQSKLAGRGTLIHKNSYRYEGEWENNRPHGKGREWYGDGGEYIGTFKNGFKHCIDETKSIKEKKQNPPKMMVVYRKDGEVYQGEFKDGLMHGYGQLTNKNKDTEYYGEFLRGKKQGYGTLRTPQGRLTGSFHNDQINGQGTFAWHDGRRYEGSFRNSRFHGWGKITYPEGNVLEGDWKDGENQNLKAVYEGEMQKSNVSRNSGKSRASNNDNRRSLLKQY